MVNTRSRNDGTGPGVTNPNNNVNEGPTPAELVDLLRSVNNELTRTRQELQEVRAERDLLLNQPERSVESYPRRNRQYEEPSPTRRSTGITPSVHSIRRRDDRVHNDGDDMDGGGVHKRHHDGGERRGEYKFKTFKDCGPAMFTGRTGPIASMRWIRQIEMTFEASNCPENKKVVFAAKILNKDALDWWDTHIQPQGSRYIASLTWESFVELFKKDLCTEWELQALESKFLGLKKGEKSITEYSRDFTKKLRFCKHLCPNDSSQVNRYDTGLPADYRPMIRMQPTLRKAVDLVKSIEHDMKYKERKDTSSGFKKKFDGASRSGSSKKRKGGSSRENDTKQAGNWCACCRSKHSGPCSISTLSCSKCTDMGHLAKDCTAEPRCHICKQTGHQRSDCPFLKTADKKNERPKTTTRAFNMTAELARADDEVVSGTFIINSSLANVLFDSGANRSFVSTLFAPKLGVVTRPLDNPIEVEIIDGRTSMVRDGFFDCSIEIEGCSFSIDFLPTTVAGFDIVVGMD
uniref:uncharacterized protein LOC122610302 n=1 Tax=Erigeron canadensis TaxID=72917 RepID=UPI001CB96D6A|nr:uncharacterized protein LOC122610302 [Erigeron canadensis]